MRFTNAMIYGADFSFRPGEISVKNGKFVNEGEGETIDLGGAYLLPGLVDIHIHGCAGADFANGTVDDLMRMGMHLASKGITSFAPASLTLPEEALLASCRSAAAYARSKPEHAAALRGVNMEGPFFSAEKKGAQNPAYLRLPDAALFERLQEAAEGLIKIAAVAPELAGAFAYIQEVSRNCTVSLAHTNAGYDIAAKAFDLGAGHVTHLFNAMPPLLHREPGVIGAASERAQVIAELVCDGHHVHPSSVRAAFRLFGPERICLISDAASCCGMPDGQYELGGLETWLRGGVVRMKDGTIAGAASDVWANMRNAIAFGIPPQDVVRAATWNPAKVLGVEESVGSIAVGKQADFVVCTPAFERLDVYIAGKRVEQAGE